MSDGTVVSEDGVRLLLEGLGFDVRVEGLRDTPRRVAKAYRELTSGYRMDAAAVLGVTFEAPSRDIVVLAGIPFVSLCEHHLLPFTGSASVAYIPNGRVVGLSKLARVVDVFAKRLQLQERLTHEIAQSIEQHLGVESVAVTVEAVHSCMAIRGVQKTGAVMRTNTLRGVFKTDAAARAEVLKMLER